MILTVYTMSITRHVRISRFTIHGQTQRTSLQDNPDNPDFIMDNSTLLVEPRCEVLKKYDVLTVLDTCVDQIVSGKDVVPEFGQVEKLVGDYLLEMGGSCCIFACQAAKLGLRTAGAGCVGADAFGKLVFDRLLSSGVLMEGVSVDDYQKTGLGIALCKPGDRAIATVIPSADNGVPQSIEISCILIFLLFVTVKGMVCPSKIN